MTFLPVLFGGYVSERLKAKKQRTRVCSLLNTLQVIPIVAEGKSFY
jgi:hypothetical protein